MAVTAKFSQSFYDRLGHDIVEELVEFLNRIATLVPLAGLIVTLRLV